MDSFLGGIADFGAGVPSYGDIGPDYTNDFFGTDFDIENLGRSLLSGLMSSQRGSSFSSRGPISYSDQTRSTMNDMLAQAIQAFEAPSSVI